MINYEWKVNNAQTRDEPLPQTAVFATFTVVATDDATGAQEAETGAVDLLPADPDSFVQINEVTQEQAVAWVKAALAAPGKDSVEVYEQRLAAKLAEQAAQPKVASIHTFE
jgi:hypothetical protein